MNARNHQLRRASSGHGRDWASSQGLVVTPSAWTLRVSGPLTHSWPPVATLAISLSIATHIRMPPQGSTDCILLHEYQASLNPGATAWTIDTNMASGLWWLPVPWWSLQKIQSRKQAFLHLKLLSLPGARGISWLGSRSRTKSSSADWYTPFHWSCWAVTAVHQPLLSRVTAIMSPVPPLSIVHAQLCFSVFPSFLHTCLSLWCLCIPESIF